MSCDISGSPVADSTPPLQSARVQPLAGELQSCMLQSCTHFFCLQPVCKFPGSVPVGSWLSGRCFKISNWVPFTYSPYVSQSYVWEPLQEWVFCSLQFYNFPEYISHWFSKSGILGACLSCIGSRGWDGWCGTWIPHNWERRSVPLLSLPVVDCCIWDVVFPLGNTVYLSYPSQLSFYLLLWRLSSFMFHMYLIKFVVPMGRGEFRLFLC